MSFIIDKQTLQDLKIFGKVYGNSIYGLFNHTQTRGGGLLLEEMFRYPLADAVKINQRSQIIRFFTDHPVIFPFRAEWFDILEHYLSDTDQRSRLSSDDNTLQRKLRKYIGADTATEQLHKGVLAGIELVNATNDFLNRSDTLPSNHLWIQEAEQLRKLLQDSHLQWALEEKETKKLTYEKLTVFDRKFRYEGHEQLQQLLHAIYRLDTYLSVAKVAQESGFVFGKALASEQTVLKLEGIYHPLLPNAVANTIETNENNNLIFLTGANMAGKSTLMKTFGIVMFLAHLGFPLPAQQVEFSVMDGMYTTINLPDNLNMGYSHFYAEVLRIKKVAEQISRSQKLIVIFDELFRGTNVKDAYDATVAIAAAFAEKKNCIFLISTHIIEAGEELKKRCRSVNYVYLPTLMNGNSPTYTYRLSPGITNDRHGMMIVRNEGILEILKKDV